MNCGFCGKKLDKKYSIIKSNRNYFGHLKMVCKDCEIIFKMVHNEFKRDSFTTLDEISYFVLSFDHVSLRTYKKEQN